MTITDSINSINVDLINLQVLVVEQLPCEVVIGRLNMATNNLYKTFQTLLLGSSDSLGEMLSCRCGEATTKPLSNKKLFSSNTSVSDSCVDKTLSAYSGNSKSRKLLNYGRVISEPVQLSLVQFQKEELLDVENDEDYVDDYLDRDDRYSNSTEMDDKLQTRSINNIPNEFTELPNYYHVMWKYLK